MADFVDHPECQALSDAIAPLAAGIKDVPPYWIETPDGTLVTNSGSEWCGDCAYYLMRHHRRKDRKRAEDYYLGGGSRTEEEHLCYCAGCGKHLQVTLLKYGRISELEHWREYGFGARPDEDAYALVALLDACVVVTEEDDWQAIEAAEIGRRFATMNSIEVAA